MVLVLHFVQQKSPTMTPSSSSCSGSSQHQIECSDQPLDISFHPLRPSLLAAALVDGTVEVHDFAELLHQSPPKRLSSVKGKNKEEDEDDNDDEDDDEMDTIVSSTRVHTQLLPSKLTPDETTHASARCCTFSSNGRFLWSGGTAGDLVCLDAERIGSFDAGYQQNDAAIVWSIPNASYLKSSQHVLQEFSPEQQPHLLLAGDEQGCVRIFDVRLCGESSRNGSHSNPLMPNGCIHSWKTHDDYISSVSVTSDGTTLLAASADCTLSVYDIRMPWTPLPTSTPGMTGSDKDRYLRRSDDQEDELLSMQIIKNGRKVVCGTGEGVLAVFSYGTWGDCSDRFPIFSGSGGGGACIDTLLKVDEDTLLVGSSDGAIRVVSIHPDKVLGFLGDTNDHGGFPVEKIQFDCNRDYVGSITHDNIIRLWDARVLRDDDDDDDCGHSDHVREKQTKQDGLAAKLKQAPTATADVKMARGDAGGDNSDDEWEDMNEDMDVDSDDDDDDDSDSGKKDGENSAKNEKRTKRLNKNDNFFADL